MTLKSAGQLEQAAAAYREALRLKPDYAEAHNNLGIALGAQGEIESAIEAYQHALSIKPDLVGAYNNLGNAFKNTGQHDEAIAAYREALRLQPNYAEAHSNLLFELHYQQAGDAKTIHQESLIWNQRHAGPLKKFIQLHTNSRDPQRRLKIGYVSADFRKHVVGWNLLPLLEQHDRKHFEIICYSNVVRTDAMTESIRNTCAMWRNIAGVADQQAAQMIRDDQIDILIDLALHTSLNRLLLFALKPAPIQMTYLGYPGSTGLDTIDYRLSDPHLDPPETDLSVYSEETIHLPETYWCYQPGGSTPLIAPPPVKAAGYITFGCLNNFAKVSPMALELWSQILQATAHARLIIHSHPGTHRNKIREHFGKNAITMDRIEFTEHQAWLDYLNTYSRIDIGLDPIPYNGGITSCDSLWMGVPVVSLAGRTAVGRAGKSILSNIDLQELVANTPEEYVGIAVKLAGDLPRLTELRHTLRERMQTSPLMDARRFTRNMEVIYRDIWRKWCGGAASR